MNRPAHVLAAAMAVAAVLVAGSGRVVAQPAGGGPVAFGEVRSSVGVRVVDLAGGGDVTGDGLADLLVGVEESGELGVGVRVVAGGRGRSAWVESIAEVSGLRVGSGRAADGSVVEACPVGVLGDVSGDGVGELLLSSCAEVESLGRPLRVFVVFGSAEPLQVRLDGLAGRGFEVVLERPQVGDLLRTIAVMGDVDGRGSPGLVVAFGPLEYDDEEPPAMSARVYRVDGRGVEVWAEYSGSVASARAGGDFNGDGRDEVVLVDVTAEDSAARVVRTPAAADPRARAVRALGEDELHVSMFERSFNGDLENRGTHGNGVGDFNGDGYDDVGIGSPHFPEIRSIDKVVLGGPDGERGEVSLGNRLDNNGVPIQQLGDLDGDGRDDILLTRFFAAPGELIVVFGRAELGSVHVGSGSRTLQLLRAQRNLVSEGFGRRSVVANVDGTIGVAALDRARESLYEFVLPPAVPRSGVAFDGIPGSIQRVEPPSPSGMERSLSVAQLGMAGFRARRVVIARDDMFADALSAAPLLDGGVLLLGPREGPTEELIAEVERVLLETFNAPTPAKVFLMGGEDALSDRYEVGMDQILASRGVRRVQGASRVETSVEVARLVAELDGGGRVGRVGVARAFGTPEDESAGWVDSVTAGGWAADSGTPILLTSGPGLHPAVGAAVEELGVSSSVVLGGEAAVPEGAAASLPSPVRVAGSERAGTAAAIAAELWPAGTTRRLLVNAYQSDGWTFGLPAAALSAESDAPLLLSDRDALPAATVDALGCGLDLLLLGDDTVIGADPEAQALAATAC